MSLYNDYKNDINNFSYWFPKIENCGIKVPKSVIIDVPEKIISCFFMECKDDSEKIAEWVKEKVMPAIDEMECEIFIKNGCFSNKFEFNNCMPGRSYYGVVQAVIDINYVSLMYDTGGNTEMIIRERIGDYTQDKKLYRIYQGMPLRPEFRVFYDYDNHKVLYSVNYWDWDYCHDRICEDKTDGLAYEAAYSDIEKFFKEHQLEVEKLVDEHMANVDLQGVWSVDIMWADNDFWLIDMAVDHRSAYFDSDKCKGG